MSESDYRRLKLDEIPVCEEMKKLRNYLDKHKIEWEDDSSGWEFEGIINYTCRTHFYYLGGMWSVINGLGTYGGYSFNYKNQGALELMIVGHDPEGFLTAQNIIDMIEGRWL